MAAKKGFSFCLWVYKFLLGFERNLLGSRVLGVGADKKEREVFFFLEEGNHFWRGSQPWERRSFSLRVEMSFVRKGKLERWL